MAQKKTKRGEDSQVHASPPSKKSATKQRYREKVAKDVFTKPNTKGISIKEHVTTRSTGKHVSVATEDKGKRKAPLSLSDSDSDSSDVPLVRKTTRGVQQARIIPDITPIRAASSDSQHEEGDDEANITRDSSGYVRLPLEYTKKFTELYADRNICKMFYVDLVDLCNSTELDLTSYLGQYIPWLSINMPYCPKIVRQFYCNLAVKNNCAVEEDELVTSVRGTKFGITSSKINTWLGIHNPPNDGFKLRNEREIFETLLPGEPVRALEFQPAMMSDVHRVLWYIYSRNLVNKGGNFSHFSGMDYSKFASFIAKDVRNLGDMIFNVLKNFINHSTRLTPLPFPQLVSLFLHKNGIWYLEPNEPFLRLPKFGRKEIERMGIKLPLIENRVSKQGQSTPSLPSDIPSSSGDPAFVNLVMKHEIREAISEMLILKLNENQKTMFSMIYEQFECMELLKTGLMELNQSVERLHESIQAIQTRQERLERKLNDIVLNRDAELHDPLLNLSKVDVDEIAEAKIPEHAEGDIQEDQGKEKDG